MMQEIFNRISAHGIADWAVVLQGASGIPGHSDRLPPYCVESFANAALEKIAMDDPFLDVIVSLADDSDLPASELCSQLQKMCDSKNSDMQRAKLIWRAAALEEVIANIDSDPLYGLIKLSEFWRYWGWPVDAPPSMLQSVNPLQENIYHSASNYDRVICEHEQWLKTEFLKLKNNTTD